MIGQEDAVTAVAKAVRRNRTGMGDAHRPVGSFLFLGPTGVGKTELAKALAASLFEDESAVIRFDMSEFGERHTVSRLVGRPSGIRRIRRGGSADRARAPQPLLDRPVRRDRESPPRRVRPAAAGAGRRPADRRPGPDRRLPQHGDRHDLEHRQRVPRLALGCDRLHRGRGRRDGLRQREGSTRPRDGKAPRGHASRVPQPHRRDRAVPQAGSRAAA